MVHIIGGSFLVTLFAHVLGDFVTIDWNATNVIGDPLKETERYPPKYVEYSPCPCDLTENSCDSHCCCDEECTASTRTSIFNCPKEDDSKLQRYQKTPCRNQVSHILQQEPFHLFFCILFVHSPHLGDFYPQDSERILTDSDEYTEKLRVTLNQRKKDDPEGLNHHGFSDFVKESVRPEIVRKKYVYDSAIVTHSHPRNKKTNTLGYLSLPTADITSYGCSWKSPIRFLVSSKDSCWTTVTRDSCATEPTLNAHNYVTREKKLREDREESPKIFANYPGDNAPSPKIQTFYLCKNQEFSKIAASRLAERMNLDPRKLFGFENQTASDADSEIKQYIACELDPLKSLPDPPKVQAKSDIETVCSNVVRSVRYTMIWNASEIVGINARVFIQDIDLSTVEAKEDVQQNFFVQWRDQRDKEEEKVTDPLLLSDFPRSGNPGYDPRKPIISGYSVDEITANEPQIEIREEEQIFIFQPDFTGLCAYSEKRSIKFLADTNSVCHIRLKSQNFSNCETLRLNVWRGISTQFDPDHILATGIAYQSIINFTPIIRQNITKELRDFNFDFGTSEGSGENEEITITEPLQSQNTFCSRIPSHIVLEILYSEAGRVNEKSIHEIVGAYVRYEFTDWLFTEGTGVQQYPVHTSVRFNEKSLRPPEPVKSYYLREHRDRCPSLVTCWDDLFYPFRDLRKAVGDGTEYLYSLAMGLSSVIVVIVGFAISKPWW